jgi:hypothetical protein
MFDILSYLLSFVVLVVLCRTCCCTCCITCCSGQKARAVENERLVIAKEILEHELKLMCATRDDAHVSIADLMKRSKLKQEADLDAEGAEEKRKLQAAYAKQMGANSLSDKTRLKQADERNTEERRFIALDLVLHPELYVEASDEGEWEGEGGWGVVHVIKA